MLRHRTQLKHVHPPTAFPTLILVLALVIPPAPARSESSGASDDVSFCGTHPAAMAVAAARHRDSRQRHERRSLAEERLGIRSEASAPHVYQAGEIAVIDDDGTLVLEPNPFDFSGRSIQFLRRPKGASAVRSKLGFKELIGERLELERNGSVEIGFPDDFRFPFFDRVHDRVWVNANGNVTFGEGDDENPDLPEFIGGPPRIAALWTELDPTGADGGVYVSFPPGRVRVTWLRLPEVGSGAVSSVQLTLFTTGRAVVAFGEVQAAVAVVGVSPGGGTAELRLADFDRELPLRPAPGAIVEAFLPVASVDLIGVARTFFQHFQDRYGHVILWADFDLDLGDSTAFATGVKNDVRGLGEPLADFGHIVGTENLYSFVQMGRLGQYPDDPDQTHFGTFSTMDVLGHEFGHRWLVRTHFLDGGSPSTDLLGRDLDHWSFYMDTDGSLMEGNDLLDNGDGSFTTADATTGFSLLDQYLMGLIPPGEVPPFYYVRAVDGPGPAANPRIGVTFRGERVDLSVQDIIDAEGPRDPAAEESPDFFRTAFVLLGREGEPVSQEAIDKLDAFRARWLSYIQEATDGRARAGTRLLPR